MADIRKVTDDFSVAPQLQPGDMADAAAQGFVLVINNRPDDEVPGQPGNAEMEAAARAAASISALPGWPGTSSSGRLLITSTKPWAAASAMSPGCSCGATEKSSVTLRMSAIIVSCARAVSLTASDLGGSFATFQDLKPQRCCAFFSAVCWWSSRPCSWW